MQMSTPGKARERKFKDKHLLVENFSLCSWWWLCWLRVPLSWHPIMMMQVLGLIYICGACCNDGRDCCCCSLPCTISTRNDLASLPWLLRNCHSLGYAGSIRKTTQKGEGEDLKRDSKAAGSTA